MTQQNRFLEVSDYLAHVPARAARGSRRVPVAGTRPGWSGQQSLARPMSAADRALVVLLDNGGVDLGLPGLVDLILRELPGSGAIPDSVRRDIVTWLQRKLKEITDNLLESAELALARYEQAKPGQYADVTVLRNSTSLAEDLKAKLFALGRAGKIIDLYVLTHGSVRSIAINDGGADITDVTIRGWKTAYGKALPLRSVYMMNCEASTLNQAWLDAGAKVVSGSVGLNVLPEPTTYFFWNNWKAGQNFATAITSAYNKTVGLINTAVRTPVSAIPIVGDDLAKGIDVSTIPAIRSSGPVVTGDNTITIASDKLTFATSLAATSLATVVVPMSELPAVTASEGVARAASPAGLAFIREWEQDAGADLEARVASAVRVLNETVSVPLNQNQVDALACFICGIGEDAFRSSTLLRLLRDGNHDQVPAEMVKWIQARRGSDVVPVDELLRRRRAEADYYRRPQELPATNGTSLARSLYVGGGSLAEPTSAYSYQQNPVIGGIALADAIQIGLGAAALVQSGIQAGGGSLAFTYDKFERLLTTQARLAMPGAAVPKHQYSQRFLTLYPNRPGQATADLLVTWEGNAFGEIGTVVMKKDLDNSTDWSRSSAQVTVTRVNKIPPANTDPRTWPITYRYEGSYDPVGNGHWEFEGEFEINAFGGFKVNLHKVVSRSAIDMLISHEDAFYVKRGTDYVPPVPPLPAEQLDYLRKTAT
jgi:GH24 family phage-related lysozyme (muramidase)